MVRVDVASIAQESKQHTHQGSHSELQSAVQSSDRLSSYRGMRQRKGAGGRRMSHAYKKGIFFLCLKVLSISTRTVMEHSTYCSEENSKRVILHSFFLRYMQTIYSDCSGITGFTIAGGKITANNLSAPGMTWSQKLRSFGGRRKQSQDQSAAASVRQSVLVVNLTFAQPAGCFLSTAVVQH